VSNTPKTERIYAAAQAAFSRWCRDEEIRPPASHEAIAAYLCTCMRVRGPSAVPVHLSAIAQLYRSFGRTLDTKSAVIQSVVSVARKQMRATSQ
jgi:hypothetical protein